MRHFPGRDIRPVSLAKPTNNLDSPIGLSKKRLAIRRPLFYPWQKLQVDSISFLCCAQKVRNESPAATPSAGLTQPPNIAICRNPLINNDIAFMMRTGLDPNKTENQ
jgi:hypothetical protein